MARTYRQRYKHTKARLLVLLELANEQAEMLPHKRNHEIKRLISDALTAIQTFELK